MKDVVKITTLRRERSNIVIYKVKIKSIFSDIKNERAKVIKKINNIMHSELQIKKMK